MTVKYESKRELDFKSCQNYTWGGTLGVWKGIGAGWESCYNYVRYESGDRKRVSFQHDVWCADSVPNLLFTELFYIANNRHARKSDYMEARTGVVHWNPVLVRQVQD